MNLFFNLRQSFLSFHSLFRQHDEIIPFIFLAHLTLHKTAFCQCVQQFGNIILIFLQPF